jgi:flavin-dependent dehydrogenase
LHRLLDGAQPLWRRPLAVSPIPYGFLAGSSRGPWCIGDQAAVIPSFTGDGISIGLHSAALAAELFLAGRSAAAYHRTLHTQLRKSMTIATALSLGAVTATGRATALLAASIFPRAMRTIAQATRIPERCILGRQDALTEPPTPPGSFSATPQAP